MAGVIYTFRGELQAAQALHIGSGGEGADTDAAIVRDARGRPYIPGSSLRGALRAAIERYARALFGLELSHLEDEGYFRGLRKKMDQQPSETGIVKLLEGELNELDRLFGTVYWASPLTIEDLPLQQAQALTEVRHGVGIDRDTGAARDAVKYDFETLTKGQSFRLAMRCEIDSTVDEQLGATWRWLLALGLVLLEEGRIVLGGRAARGVGQVRLSNLTVHELDTTDRAAYLQALIAGGEALDGAERPGWARAQLASQL